MRSTLWPGVTASGLAAVAVCVSGGCASSPPMHYYMLSEIGPEARLTVAPDTVTVRLARVTIPTELDRAQLVRRIDATRLQILETERWAAPLDDMIRRVISDNLAARLPANLVADPNEPSLGEKRQLLSVDVREFYGDTRCAVTLRAAWIVKQPDADSIQQTEETRVPATGDCSGTGGLPVAMSRALAQLSDRIAAAIAKNAGGPSHQGPSDP